MPPPPGRGGSPFLGVCICVCVPPVCHGDPKPGGEGALVDAERVACPLGARGVPSGVFTRVRNSGRVFRE